MDIDLNKVRRDVAIVAIVLLIALCQGYILLFVTQRALFFTLDTFKLSIIAFGTTIPIIFSSVFAGANLLDEAMFKGDDEAFLYTKFAMGGGLSIFLIAVYSIVALYLHLNLRHLIPIIIFVQVGTYAFLKIRRRMSKGRNHA